MAGHNPLHGCPGWRIPYESVAPEAPRRQILIRECLSLGRRYCLLGSCEGFQNADGRPLLAWNFRVLRPAIVYHHVRISLRSGKKLTLQGLQCGIPNGSSLFGFSLVLHDWSSIDGPFLRSMLTFADFIRLEALLHGVLVTTHIIPSTRRNSFPLYWAA